ncbi:MAG: hypothetical protein ABEL51_11100 [Salinibacter sp.]
MNAVNPDVPRNEARIYRFKVTSREPAEVELASPDPLPIESQMVFKDLFTFDRSGQTPKNFERQYQAYERKIESVVDRLKEKIGPLVESMQDGNCIEIPYDFELEQLLFEVFTLKFINFGRNPYGVRKFLNSLPREISNFVPNDPELQRIYDSISHITEEECRRHLKRLNITLDEYQEWLRALFILLLPSGTQRPDTDETFDSLLEEVAYDLVHDPNCHCEMRIDVLSEDQPYSFLVSDRTYFYSEQSKARLILHFNVTSNLALTFQIVYPSTLENSLRLMARQGFPNKSHETIEKAIKETKRELTERLENRLCLNDLEFVAWFNQHTILQAHSHVFCSRPAILGAEISDSS